MDFRSQMRVTYIYEDPNISKLPIFVVLAVETILLYLSALGDYAGLLTVATIVISVGSMRWYNSYFIQDIEMASWYIILGLLRNTIAAFVLGASGCSTVLWIALVLMYFDAFVQRGSMGKLTYVTSREKADEFNAKEDAKYVNTYNLSQKDDAST